jgi:hypothetical protein
MKDVIFISQIKYAKELVKKFDIGDCKVSDMSMTTNANLDVNEKGKQTDIHQYRIMIDSILYLMASRQDIMFSIYLCVRYQVNPK